MPTSASSPQSAATMSSDDVRVELRGAGAEELVALMQANGRGRQRSRVLALVGAVLGVAALGTAGVFAYQALTDSGPQPESVLPSTTVAFVKIDLDPSAGQKVDALRFLRSFPAAAKQFGGTSDLRKVAFEAIQDQGKLARVDYAKDVEPWLGQRLGVGVVPDASAKEGVRPVIALSISDAVAAERHLPALATALGGQCRILKAFAVCTGGTTTTALDTLARDTGRGSLADAATYREDMGDLGEDGVASAWVDSAKAGELLTGLGAVAGRTTVRLEKADGLADAGRAALALRFDGPSLELAGHVNGAKTKAVGGQRAGGTITSLPWDTLAAVSVANAGDQLEAGWPEIEKSLRSALGEKEYAAGLEQVEGLLGISVPDDVYAALGSQLAIAFGGLDDAGAPNLALLTNGDPDVLRTLARPSGDATGSPLTLRQDGAGHTVLGTSAGYAEAVAAGKGLGDMPSFKDALEDVEDARVVAYMDISGIVTEFGDQIPAETSANLAHLGALGLTVSAEGDSSDFVLRLTTK